MCPGLAADLQQIDDARKTKIIDRELARLNIDVAALQETRLAESGSLRESDYTFYWQGKPPDEPRQHGVGFAVRNSLTPFTEPPSSGTERLLTLRLSTSNGTANIICAYAPTLCSTPEEKDQFYEALDKIISDTPRTESLYLLGDFNARVGADNKAWPSCLGVHGRGKINENGQRLLELCSFHGLCITNTLFKCKDIHKVSWRHPRSRHWHQLDLIITRRADLQSVLLTRSYHSADCDTDHSLVASKVRVTPKKIHHAKKKGRPRINTYRVNNASSTADYMTRLGNALGEKPTADSIDTKWTYLRDAVYNCAIEAFGKKERKNEDWFEAHLEEMQHVTDHKRKALLAYKEIPSRGRLKALQDAKRCSQRTARRCANDYWLDLCQSIQRAADTGDVRMMYEGIKKALGPPIRKTAPLKSKTGEVITDQGKVMERWVEHYLELYATQTIVTTTALDAIEDMPILEELDIPPTEDEVSKAINNLSSGKAPGSDGIPSEILKCGKPVLLQPLHELLHLCWEGGHIPQDMRDATIVTLYKNKGDRSDCNNYRGISLLSIVGKAFARVALQRLQTLAARVYPESQCGFRACRSTIDMVFSLRQLQEKCREQQMPLFIAFIDLTKAFDLVSRSGLFALLQKIGCPPRLLSIVSSFHEDMHSTVCFNGTISEAFPVSSGVKQGCVLAPTLFGIFFSMLLHYAFRDCDEGIYIHTRSDGKLYNIARLRAKTKVQEVLIRELLFADDAALSSHTEDGLQKLVDRFAEACKEFGLTISLKKTQILAQGAEHPPEISIGDHKLEVVDHFTYLGSTVSSCLSIDREINTRIAKAASVMSRLKQRVWNNSNLSLQTKLHVYRACVLSTLLYSSEAWTTHTRHEQKLNSFHMRCLRRILGIVWQDKITNSEVLERAGMQSLIATLCERRLRWLGHVRRMEAGRIPKDLMYGELVEGTRALGRPYLRFKDACKRDMKKCGISVDSWEDLAADRATWRHEVRTGVERREEERDRHQEEKKMKRKTSKSQPLEITPLVCTVCQRNCQSRIGLYSHSRKCSK